MILKAINLKRLALKSAFTKGYISARTSLSPSYQAAKEQAHKAKAYAPSPVGAGLYGTSLFTTGKVAKLSFKASQIYGNVEIPVTILKIIQRAYQSESFYRASWKIKSQILAKRILKSPIIQRNISEIALSAIIYNIMQKYKNKQGNEELAVEIQSQAGLEIKE